MRECGAETARQFFELRAAQLVSAWDGGVAIGGGGRDAQNLLIPSQLMFAWLAMSGSKSISQ